MSEIIQISGGGHFRDLFNDCRIEPKERIPSEQLAKMEAAKFLARITPGMKVDFVNVMAEALAKRGHAARKTAGVAYVKKAAEQPEFSLINEVPHSALVPLRGGLTIAYRWCNYADISECIDDQIELNRRKKGEADKAIRELKAARVYYKNNLPGGKRIHEI